MIVVIRRKRKTSDKRNQRQQRLAAGAAGRVRVRFADQSLFYQLRVLCEDKNQLCVLCVPSVDKHYGVEPFVVT